jgi:hypothetical protein
LRSDWIDVLYWLSCGLIAAGAYMIYVPAAPIVLGIAGLGYARMGMLAGVKPDERSR